MNKQRFQDKNERTPQLPRKNEQNIDQEPTNVEIAVEKALAKRVELLRKEFQIQKDSVDLSHSQIDDLDVLNIGIFLTDQSHLHSLVHLNLSHNKITSEGLLELLIPIQFQVHLKELYLNHNEIGQASEGLGAVLPVLQELQILGLGNCGLVDEDLTQICLGIVHLENLVELQLHNNKFSNEGVTMLCASVLCVLGLIERLYLGGNTRLSKEGFVCLFECLHNNTRLKSLFVNDMPLCDDSIAALANTLVYNHSLSTISLANCGIDDTQMNLLQLALASNKTITNLYLWGNHLTENSLIFLGPFINKQKSESQQKVVLLHDNDFGQPKIIDQITQSQCQNNESIRNSKDNARDHEQQHKSISIDNFSFFGQQEQHQEPQFIYAEPAIHKESIISSKAAERPSQEVNRPSYSSQEGVNAQTFKMDMNDSRRNQKKLQMKEQDQQAERADSGFQYLKKEKEQNIVSQQYDEDRHQEYYQNNPTFEVDERNFNYEDENDEDEGLDDYFLHGNEMMGENEDGQEGNEDDDDDRDERELCKLETQLAQDIEIVQKNRESAKRDEKNTQFWKGFEKDQRSGLLKSQLS